MIYFHTDISKVNSGTYRGYIREMDYDFTASSQPLAELEAYRLIEECEGFKSFSVIFQEV
jgi:hypothetical protein